MYNLMHPATHDRCSANTLGFCALVVLHLVPIWLFAYVPTQDGPAHVGMALILRDYEAPEARYREFFDLNWRPFPNWSCLALLVGLLQLFPPLIAEKVLVSLYVIGFACSFRYFVAAFGSQAVRLAPVGLLFLFNGCFLMGFYNYCLSLILFVLTLGFCLRRREHFGGVDAVLLVLWLGLTYFTHLLGYVLSALGAAWIVGTAPGRRWRKLAWVALASLPTSCLALDAVVRPRFLGILENASWNYSWARSLQPSQVLDRLWRGLLTIEEPLAQAYEGMELQLGLVVMLFYVAGVVSHVLGPRGRLPEQSARPTLGPVAAFGAGVGVIYFLVPDSLSDAVGLLQIRLAVIPPLLWVPCLRLPAPARLRRLLVMAMYALVVVNWIVVVRFFQVANRDLAEFTAAIDQVGCNRTLYVVRSWQTKPAAKHVLFGAYHYCTRTGNVNLDNFHATQEHFPIRFRDGIFRGCGELGAYVNREMVDLLLVWDGPWDPPSQEVGPFREVCRRGRLVILERTKGRAME